jgi:hypothetical protein
MWGQKLGWRASRERGGSPGRADAIRLLGDADGDNDVDLEDLRLVREHFGTSGPAPGDADHDGDVDLQDLNAVRNNFGTQAPAPTGMPASSRPRSASRQTLAHDAVFGLWLSAPNAGLERPGRRAPRR